MNEGVDISNKRYGLIQMDLQKIGYCTLFFIKKIRFVICEFQLTTVHLKLFASHGLEVYGD